MTLNFGKFFQSAELKKKQIDNAILCKPAVSAKKPVSTAWEIDPASSM